MDGGREFQALATIIWNAQSPSVEWGVDRTSRADRWRCGIYSIQHSYTYTIRNSDYVQATVHVHILYMHIITFKERSSVFVECRRAQLKPSCSTGWRLTIMVRLISCSASTHHRHDNNSLAMFYHSNICRPPGLHCYTGARRRPPRLHCYTGARCRPPCLHCYTGAQCRPPRLHYYTGARRGPPRLHCYTGVHSCQLNSVLYADVSHSRMNADKSFSAHH